MGTLTIFTYGGIVPVILTIKVFLSTARYNIFDIFNTKAMAVLNADFKALAS